MLGQAEGDAVEDGGHVGRYGELLGWVVGGHLVFGQGDMGRECLVLKRAMDCLSFEGVATSRLPEAREENMVGIPSCRDKRFLSLAG